jgi:hypothetical protein
MDFLLRHAGAFDMYVEDEWAISPRPVRCLLQEAAAGAPDHPSAERRLGVVRMIQIFQQLRSAPNLAARPRGDAWGNSEQKSSRPSRGRSAVKSIEHSGLEHLGAGNSRRRSPAAERLLLSHRDGLYRDCGKFELHSGGKVPHYE